MISFVPSLRERAAAELELRRRARLLPFDQWLTAVTPAWRWDWPHLVYMRHQLERLRRREIDRLWMFTAPRHGKTEQNTVRFAAHWIETTPTARIIIWAYNQTLAEKFSRKIRRIVTARGIPLNPERNASGEWETKAGGGVRAAGIGVGITGMGADLILIDDPVKNRQEADSQAYRDRVYESYTDDLTTRCEPGCLIAGTMTRWHVDDLAGRILASPEGRCWTTVNLPAIAEEDDPLGRQVGEALCPDRYPIEVLEQRRLVMGRNFYALFQGRPAPAEGDTFRRSWFRYWEADQNLLILYDSDGSRQRVVPRGDCRIFMTVDLAFSLKKSADYCVVAVWAATPDSQLVLLDLHRERLAEPDLLKLVRHEFARHRASTIDVESNGAQLGVVQNLRRGGIGDDGARYFGLPVRAVPSSLDKVSRASTAVVVCQAGQLFFPRYAPWLAEYERELLSFPNDAHDDQVDVTSMAAADVFMLGGSGVPTEEDLEFDQLVAAGAAATRREEHRSIDNEDWWEGR